MISKVNLKYNAMIRIKSKKYKCGYIPMEKWQNSRNYCVRKMEMSNPKDALFSIASLWNTNELHQPVEIT